MLQSSPFSVHQKPWMLSTDIVAHRNGIFVTDKIGTPTRDYGKSGCIGNQIRFNIVVVYHDGIIWSEVASQVISDDLNPFLIPETRRYRRELFRIAIRELTCCQDRQQV